MAIQQMAAYLRAQGQVTEGALAALSAQLEPTLGALAQGPTPQEELQIWLQRHALEAHLPRLESEVHQLEDVAELADADLEALGMPLAARRRFLRAAESLDQYMLERGTATNSTLATVWRRHLDALRKRSPAAVDLLVLLLFLTPDDVDSQWLPELARARGAGPLHEFFFDGDAHAGPDDLARRANELLALLADHSLIDSAQVGDCRTKKRRGKRRWMMLTRRGRKKILK